MVALASSEGGRRGREHTAQRPIALRQHLFVLTKFSNALASAIVALTRGRSHKDCNKGNQKIVPLSHSRRGENTARNDPPLSHVVEHLDQAVEIGSVSFAEALAGYFNTEHVEQE